MTESTLSDFCGSPFWDANLTWYTDDPELTTCFEQTVLVWVPVLFLWLFLSLDLYFTLTSKSRDIPWTWKNVSKFVVNALLIVICIADFIYVLVRQSQDVVVHNVNIYTPVIRFLSFVMSLGLIMLHKKFGQMSSGLLCTFWFIICIFGIPQFRTDLYQYQDGTTELPGLCISYMILYCLFVIMFLLNFFADDPPTKTDLSSTDNPCPESTSSFPSRLTYGWFDKLALLGFRRPLVTTDLWNLNKSEMTKIVSPQFDHYWNKAVDRHMEKKSANAAYMKRSASVEFIPKKTQKPASILGPLCKAFGPTFLAGSSMKLIQDLLSFVSPQILKLLIGFVEDQNEPLWRGYLYAVILVGTAIIQTLVLSQYFQKMFLVGLHIRTCLISAVYRKALRISSSSRKESTVGEIVNLMAVDAQRFMDLTTYLNMIWSAPLQIALALYFLWQILGPSVLAGLAVMIIMIPINGYIANKVKTLQIKQMKNKDERVKMMNEILSGIKVLKLYAWEPSFEQQVLKIRGKEIKVLKQAAYFNAATSFIWACAPYLVSLATFATFVLSDKNNVLDAKTAFVSLSLFNILRFPLSMLPMLIMNAIQASVSVKRINKFMNLEELDPDSVTHEPSERDPLIMENGTFSWDKEGGNTLKDLSFRVREGSLVAVVGAVGSGKSSLLSAFLGEMDKITGRINTKGSIAYVPQLAWIQNATLKDNILFGRPLNEKNYKKIVDACALIQDIDMLPGGDQTEIGEKGINLSGGQKQRVSLARAVYYDSDVYFLDDPLSAVDSHVGKHIFENVIGPTGILKKKTRLLVTHAITYLPQVDMIIVLKDGMVSEMGTYKELLDKKGAFSDFIMTHLQEASENDDQEDLDEIKQQLLESNPELQEKLQRQVSRQRSVSSDTGSSHSLNRRRSSDGSQIANNLPNNGKVPGTSAAGEKLIEAEKAETGGVKWSVYKHYLKSIGPLLSTLTILLNVIFQGFSIGTNIWLSIWSSDNETQKSVNETIDTSKRDMYLEVYGLLGLGQISFVGLASLTLLVGCVVASLNLHRILLTHLMRNPMEFFDITPLGRIINRVAKDIDIVDNVLPMTFRMFLTGLCVVVGTLFVISYSTPIFVVVIIPIGLIYYFIQRFYVATSRQLKRLESVSRSPIYSHFGESVTGTVSIRAYNVQDRFIVESQDKVDFNQVCYYPSLIANRWLAVRLEMVGNLIIFFAALFAVLGRHRISSGLVGLSVSYALQITQTLNWLVRMTAEVETNIVAVERIKEYGETPQEASWDLEPSPAGAEWPENGKVEFKGFTVRYREGLDLVLKGISFTISGGEKVGIVGRTGAGKSSLTLSLFRIIEAAGGNILIDGIDISKLGLHKLRSRLTIIPQDPVLFSGSLRMNLDPFDKHTDEQVWRALELAHLKTFVKGLNAGLQHEVSEGGDNLSVGQRQLICLARALLRKTKVLILDEATAAVDLETDDLIQKTIRSEFADCTVLTIAHRINTIMDSDRVIVLDRGLMVEFDSPESLLKSKKSIFYGMAHDAGLA